MGRYSASTHDYLIIKKLVTLLLPCALKFSEGMTMFSVPLLLEQAIGSVLFSNVPEVFFFLCT